MTPESTDIHSKKSGLIHIPIDAKEIKDNTNNQQILYPV